VLCTEPMARPKSDQSDLSSIVQKFVVQIVDSAEASVRWRIQAALAGALPTPVKRGPGRPLKAQIAAPAAAVRRVRKRAKVFCPVPGCKNVAAPVFGMVCSKHKDVAKAQIKKYRELRRAAK
jgi:hypothetical protein